MDKTQFDIKFNNIINNKEHIINLTTFLSYPTNQQLLDDVEVQKKIIIISCLTKTLGPIFWLKNHNKKISQDVLDECRDLLKTQYGIEEHTIDYFYFQNDLYT